MESFKNIGFSLPVLFLVFLHSSYLLSVSNFERALKTGDTFTPGEMLPVALKLLEKIEIPGSGKGIISISKSAEDLADRLFETFFMTTKRFVTLTEFDIQGLDALQALALSGDATNNGEIESVTEEPLTENAEMMLRGQIVKLNSGGLRSKYKLLTKNIKDKQNIKRRGIELAKKLSKKRRLVVKNRKNNPGKPKESSCRWRYECSHPGDLDSCQLHTQCGYNNTMTTASYIGPQKHVSRKEIEAIKTLRRMLGLTEVDEEVEKILETRMLYAKSNNVDLSEELLNTLERLLNNCIRYIFGLQENDRVESLSEYFNRIIMAQAVVESTTAVTNNYMNAQPEGSNEPTESVINSENSQNEDNNASVQNIDNGRRKLHKKRQF